MAAMLRTTPGHRISLGAGLLPLPLLPAAAHQATLLPRARLCPVLAASADSEDGAHLLAQFMRHVHSSQQSWPLEDRKPSHLMPPTTVVRVQMDALMRNDWPDEDSGIKTAFSFAMPARAEEMLAGQGTPPVTAARAWDAVEKYLSLDNFAKLLRDPMYASIINCTHWEMASPMIFHGPANKRALQAVRIKFLAADGSEKSRTYTFCLEKVGTGAYKNCWMVVGTRLGDYANV